MPLAAGTRLGPYQTLARIGAGGMGEVYRAHDPRMGRDVAIKISAERFGDRFSREVRAIAALNHANICQLYDVGPNYLVMELVEGPTLAERIQQGPIPLEEALAIARQIAEGIEAAHEKGIVHRDLKPGNIKLRPDGTVKVLDFGLAKRTETSDAGAWPEDSPTLTLEAATGVGIILGTAAYMSPEQTRGEAAVKHSDIWSFGAVLHEMLSGQRAFGGESTSDTLAAVLKLEPDWGALPKKTPAAIRRLIRRCLTKDRRQRLQAIGEARIVIEECLSGAPEMAEHSPAPRSIVAWAAAGMLTIALIGVSWVAWRATRPPNRPLVRLDVDLGPEVALPTTSSRPNNVTISPDGTRLVFVSGNQHRLYTRWLDQSKATELPGTDGASLPFFSPDGQWVGFFTGNFIVTHNIESALSVADTKLNKISVKGGAPVSLTDVAQGNGGSWGAAGNIILGGGPKGLLQVRDSGGPPITVLEVAPGESSYRSPQILPGGKAVLFANGNDRTGSIEVFSFPDRQRKTVIRDGVNPYYLPSGHLIYTNQATLFAISFDLNRLETRGTAVPILNDFAYSPAGSVNLSFAQNGVLVYRRGGADRATQIQWVGSTGKKDLLLAKPGVYSRPRIFPDGKRLALIQAGDVWVYDLQRDTMTRLTFDGHSLFPVSSPDGTYVVFNVSGKGIYWTRADGAGQPQPLTEGNRLKIPSSFTPNGKRLAYYELAGKWQIWTVPLEAHDGELKAGQPEQFLKSQFDDLSPVFSPDGHWLAYKSGGSGQCEACEIYVRAFPPPASGQAGQWQISSGGQTSQPRWSRNGREIIYLQGDQLMKVSYSVNGDTFVPEKPRVWIDKLGGSDWDLAADGKRVAVVTAVPTAEAPRPDHEVVLLQNFFDELRRRVPRSEK